MAENLKVIATARTVTEDLLNDVAQQLGRQTRPKTYGAGGELSAPRATRRHRRQPGRLTRAHLSQMPTRTSTDRQDLRSNLTC